MTIGQKIKDLRKELNMTVDELAEKLGKNRATIYRYEKGDIGNLPLDVLEPLAKALKTTPGYLIGWDDEKDRVTATIGDLLKLMREQKNMTIDEYSMELGISPKDLYKYETGEKYVPIKVINMIVNYYSLTTGTYIISKNASNYVEDVRIKRFKQWSREFSDIEFTDEEFSKIMEYCKYLLHIRN